jgi:hypothetical protein
VNMGHLVKREPQVYLQLLWAEVVPIAQAAMASSLPQQASVGSLNVRDSPLRSACGVAGSLWSAFGNTNNMLHQCKKATT